MISEQVVAAPCAHLGGGVRDGVQRQKGCAAVLGNMNRNPSFARECCWMCLELFSHLSDDTLSFSPGAAR